MLKITTDPRDSLSNAGPQDDLASWWSPKYPLRSSWKIYKNVLFRSIKHLLFWLFASIKWIPGMMGIWSRAWINILGMGFGFFFIPLKIQGLDTWMGTSISRGIFQRDPGTIQSSTLIIQMYAQKAYINMLERDWAQFLLIWNVNHRKGECLSLLCEVTFWSLGSEAWGALVSLHIRWSIRNFDKGTTRHRKMYKDIG